jgi:hypothetical protein
MDRKLVLTNEGARHWLRQIMPPPQFELLTTRQPMSDAKLFWLTFFAGFMAFYGFIS